MTVGTWPDMLAQLEARFGKQYSETEDGGVGPNYYDCSGLTEVCLNAIGIPYTRSTYTQWDDERYEHFGPFSFGQWAALLPLLQIGDVLYFHVDGEPDPGHVGTYSGNGQFIEAPHTGEVVGQYPIPNTPSEYVWGVIRPPYASSAPPPTQETDMLIALTSTHNGYWCVKPDGSVYAYGDSWYYGGINNAGANGTTALQAGDSPTSISAWGSGAASGYLIATAKGGLYGFGNVPYLGHP